MPSYLGIGFCSPIASPPSLAGSLEIQPRRALELPLPFPLTPTSGKHNLAVLREKGPFPL